MASGAKHQMVFRASRRAQESRNQLAAAFEKQNAEIYEFGSN